MLIAHGPTHIPKLRLAACHLSRHWLVGLWEMKELVFSPDSGDKTG